MTTMDHRSCPKCGAEVPLDSASPDCREEDGVLFIRYDPRYKQVVLLNAESGLRHIVNLSAPKPASRQIGGIIGPY
jgi:hypothetical protein